ncbi:MAG: Holliday junction resolvase RuvX [Acidobacteriota bacterium]
MTQQGKKAGAMRDCGEVAGRWMALDVGSRSIGVALSDPLGITTRPLTTLRRRSLEEDTAFLLDLIRQHEVVQVVVGYPCHLNGRPSKILRVIEPLARQIELQSGLPLVWADERLSSKEAERLMAERGWGVAERRRRRDEFAAALILQWYIDEKASPPDGRRKPKNGTSPCGQEQEGT